MERVCRKCLTSKPLEAFPNKADCQLGKAWTCRDCKQARQRERRTLSNNRETKRYEKTPAGFLMRAYRNMKSRVSGVQKEKAHLYEGLSILPRNEFYIWARSNKEFWRLYRQWVASGYDRKLSPSVNRVDPEKGYTLENIEWLTHSMNSALARHRTDAVFQRIHASIAA